MQQGTMKDPVTKGVDDEDGHSNCQGGKMYQGSNTPLEFVLSPPASCGPHCSLGLIIITSCDRCSEPPNRKSNLAVPCLVSAAFLSLGANLQDPHSCTFFSPKNNKQTN